MTSPATHNTPISQIDVTQYNCAARIPWGQINFDRDIYGNLNPSYTHELHPGAITPEVSICIHCHMNEPTLQTLIHESLCLAEEIRKRGEVETQSLAITLHRLFCTLPSPCGCGWSYEEGEVLSDPNSSMWNLTTHSKYLNHAQELLSKGSTHEYCNLTTLAHVMGKMGSL